MSIQIPNKSTRRWTGPYLGNYYGDLWKTFNVDLDREEGKICLSRSLDTIADTSDTNTDTLGTIDAFLRTNADCEDRYWGLSRDGALYKVNDTSVTPTGDWVVDSLANSPTNAKDMTVFENDTTGDNGRQILFVSRDTSISILNDTAGRTWTTFGSLNTLKSGVPHPICYFSFRRIILVGDGNRVHTISRANPTATETSTASRLVVPTELQIQHIFTTTSRAWILCINLKGGDGKIVEWDGFSETYNDIHSCFSDRPLTGVNYKEVPIVLNAKGVFLEYTGKGFTPMVRNGQNVALSISIEFNNSFYNAPPSYVGGVSIKGMTVGEDGLIYINITQSLLASFRQGAGIWCLNPNTGRLYNKYSIGQWQGLDFGNQYISDAGAIFPVLASTGVAGTFIISGATFLNGNASKKAIWVLNSANNTTATRGYFITQYIPASEIRDFWDSLWIRFKRFITATNRIIVKARGTRPLMTATYAPLDKTITWVNATSFTVTLAAGDDALMVGDEVEILGGVNAGTLSHILTITGNHAALQTITIDETLSASIATATARFERWKKLGVISSTTKYEDNVNIGIDSSFIQIKCELRGPAAEMEISDLIINSTPNVHIKK